MSGTLASLAGLEVALDAGDERQVALSIERILLGHALICGFGGIPLVYMGDELGMRNDYGYVNDPDLCNDSRWMHRPYMDWQAATRRRREDTVEGRIFQGIQRIVRARKRTPHMHSSYNSEVLDRVHPHLLVFVRPHPLGDLVAVLNFSERHQTMDAELLTERGVDQPFDQLQQAFVDVSDGTLNLTPYQRYWLI